jgi:ArsR family transcriptional regulator
MLTKKQINSIKKAVFEDDDQMPVMLNALGDPGRYRIFKILMDHHEICVTDIASILGITVSAASQQLRILERIGLVRKERMGQMICYEVRDDDPLVKRFCKLFSQG